MLWVDHDKIILLSTTFPTIPMLGKNCCSNVTVFYVGNKRCCIVLYTQCQVIDDNARHLYILANVRFTYLSIVCKQPQI